MCRQSKKDERVKWQKNTKPSHAHLLCTGVDTVVVVVRRRRRYCRCHRVCCRYYFLAWSFVGVLSVCIQIEYIYINIFSLFAHSLIHLSLFLSIFHLSRFIWFKLELVRFHFPSGTANFGIAFAQFMRQRKLSSRKIANYFTATQKSCMWTTYEA